MLGTYCWVSEMSGLLYVVVVDDVTGNLVWRPVAAATVATLTPFKQNCRAVATSNVALLSGLQTIDTVSLVDLDRVLLTAQTNAAENGPWIVSAGAWTRPNPNEIATGYRFGISEGTYGPWISNVESVWVITTDGVIVPGVTPISLEQVDGLYPDGTILYVASTGSDGNAGTASSPLASVQEAFRRLDRRKWIKYARVRVMDTVSVSAVPGNLQEFNVPTPLAGAYPVLLEGVLVDSGLGQITPTGGANVVVTPTANAFVTTGLVGLVVDAYKGMILEFSGTDAPATWDGVSRTIISNTANGTFTIAGQLPAAPNAGKTFTIKKQSSKLTGTNVQVNWRNNILLIDSLEIGAFVHSFEKCFVQYSRTAWTADSTGMYVQGWESTLYDGTSSGNTAAIYDFGGVIRGGGNYWNGSASVAAGITVGSYSVRWSSSGTLNFAATGLYLLNVKMTTQLQGQTINCFFRGWSRWEEATITLGPQSRLTLDRMVMTRQKATISLTAGYFYASWISLDSALGLFDLITANQTQQVVLYQIVGTNPLARGVIQLESGSELYQPVLNTASGGAAYTAVYINSDPGISFSQLATLSGNVRSNDSSNVMQYGGGYRHTGGNVTVYFWCALPAIGNNLTSLINTPISPSRRALTLRLKPLTNTLDATAVFTVLKNGVATPITVTVPAGSTAAIADTTHTEVFANGDTLDLSLSTAASNNRDITFTATLRTA